LFAAGEVRSAGWGGLAAVSKITGLARSTINRGENDLDAAPLPKGQVRLMSRFFEDLTAGPDRESSKFTFTLARA
jgi:hypothetical protein